MGLSSTEELWKRMQNKLRAVYSLFYPPKLKGTGEFIFYPVPSTYFGTVCAKGI